MKTEMVETGNLTAQLTIVLESNDYKEDFNKEIKKYRDQAHIKGFRKGKTPLSAIKKMYGRSVLADIINNKLQSTMGDYITENEIDILGNPLPSDQQKSIDFEMKEMGDFEFIYDLGLAPAFDVQGAGDSDEYTDYKIDLAEEMVDEEITNLQKRMGEQVDVDEAIEESDILKIEITEQLSEGVEREAFVTEITAMPDRLTEEAKKKLIGKKLGTDLEIDILNFEKDTTEDYVSKYFLKDAPEGVNFQFKGTVSGIKRLKPAEVNEEFFSKAFGPDANVSTEEEAREFLRKELQDFYNEQGKSIAKRYILENLIEKNEMPLPDEFLKKWLLSTNEKLSTDEVEKDYEGFRKNLKWTLVKQNVAKKHDIKIESDDLRAALRSKIEKQFAQYGGYPGIDYDDMTNRLMENQETVQKEYEELLAERVLDKIYDTVSLKEKAVTVDEYKEIVKSLQENNA